MTRTLDTTQLPLDGPFTLETARACGATRKQLALLVREGRLRRVVRGVYVDAHLADCLTLRAQVLRLVVPGDAFVCDRTAAWLHGAPAAMAPGEHLLVPEVSCFRPSDAGRLRQGLAVSGERAVRAGDLVEVGGVLTTSPLRTALDLGRLQPTRDSRLAGMDAMAALHLFTLDELVAEVGALPRQRGVVLLRDLVPWSIPARRRGRSRLCACAGTTPGCRGRAPQVPVDLPDGSRRYLDIGCEDWLFAAEYDGRAWHSSPAQRAHDADRREDLADLGWVRGVRRRPGPRPSSGRRHRDLRRRFAAARSSYASRTAHL